MIPLAQRRAWVQQHGETALEMPPIPVQTVGAQLVDDEDDHEPWLSRGCRCEREPRKQPGERANHATQNTRQACYAVAVTGSSIRTRVARTSASVMITEHAKKGT